MNKIITLIAVLFIFGNTTFAATAVSGQIRTNTTWTKAGSPYICTGLIQVDSYSTLTIEPGTIIDLEYGIKAFHSIVFLYNATDTTVIQSHGSVVPNIEIENPNYTNTILVKHVKFISTSLNLKYQKSSIIIEESSFNNSQVQWRPQSTGTQTFTFKNNKCLATGMYLSGGSAPYPLQEIVIENNYFEFITTSGTYQGIRGDLIMNKTFKVTNNIFRNTAYIRVNTGEQIISGNTFYKVANAILIERNPLPVRIISNIFTECDEAIILSSILEDTVLIRNNSFYNNTVGVSVSYHYKNPGVYAPADSIEGPIVVDSNCFYNNKIAGFAWNAKKGTSIGANWWGSVDTNKIDSAIIDNKDDFRIGFVYYKPYLTTLNPVCKTYTPPANAEELTVNRNEMQVYPNPFLNTLQIKSESSIKSVSIYDVVGKVVYQSTPQRNSISVNTEEYPTGVYVYRIITDDNQIHTGKIIRE